MYFIFEERIIRKEVESFFNKVAYPGESAGRRPFVINGFFWKLMRWFIAMLNDFENNIDWFLGNAKYWYLSSILLRVNNLQTSYDR